MAGITISLLPQATLPLNGADKIIVEQGGVTKQSTITAGQQIALDTANAAQVTADSAASDATTALDTANTALANANAAQIDADAAQTAANNAQSTADSKLSTVAVDGTTITGDGTVGNELVANIPTIYQEITKSDFADLVLNHALVAGASYLVTDAYFSVVYDRDFPILVTAISSTDISNLSWAKYVSGSFPTSNMFFKCKTTIDFAFMRLYETCLDLFLDQTACQAVSSFAFEHVQGCDIFVKIGNAFWKTRISNNPTIIVTKNVLNVSSGTADFGLLGELDINADTYTINAGSAYDVYTVVATTPGGAQVFNINATLQNSIGNIVWSHIYTGYWEGTLTGLCTGTNTIAYMLNNTTSLVSLFKVDDNTIGLNATDFAFTQIDNAFYGVLIEIRKYN